MKEFEMYIETLIRISEINYGYKTCLSYSEGEWYSRDHSRKLTPEEVCEYIISIITDYENTIDKLEDNLNQ